MGKRKEPWYGSWTGYGVQRDYQRVIVIAEVTVPAAGAGRPVHIAVTRDQLVRMLDAVDGYPSLKAKLGEADA